MDKKTALKVAEAYKKTVAERLPLKDLYLFGSYSKGNYTEQSDIDIAVVVSHRSDNYFEDTPLLWKLARETNVLIQPNEQSRARSSYAVAQKRALKRNILIEPVLLTEGENSPLYQDVLQTGIRI